MDLVDGDDLSVCFFHPAESPHEVPEPGARADGVFGEELHAVHFCLRVGVVVFLVWHEASDDHILALSGGESVCATFGGGHRGDVAF